MANKKNNSIQKTEPISDTKSNEPQKIKVKDVDPEEYVIVKNGFQGKLIYKSSRTGEKFVWDGFGSEQEMQLRELKNAKNTSKKFFINNWFMFEEPWIVDYLGVKQYYINAVSIGDFDKIFSKTPSEIKKSISTMSDGQKKSIAYRATQLIASGDIDSRKTISILEESLGIELIER